MDGLNFKTLWKMDDLGVPLFLETSEIFATSKMPLKAVDLVSSTDGK